ncbi:toll/interleukin-1 receptor domain-containing protein [Amycolatopsis sp. FBCC-B4732]|uniref:toll/interleukin-1 receptor domain-containing protein n=1 Tax=Amycolatopsis sp. FBCC-B4732 TaxID=3079339 RepID=UPI001FF346B0|nr:toll/interleukin-1 receptor domain-containing protein [Amycolatopsis sp. FBCC-B4732]UOX89932.1 toll/interleukin-1 receptor domain-containing protein [Amycolatopsis sp. FBCC-B4732]
MRIRIFLSWCRLDKKLKEALLGDLMPALSVFSDFKVEWWEDSHLTCGEELLPGILDRLDEADFGLILLSNRYFGSPFILEHELPRFAGPTADKQALPVALSPLPRFEPQHDFCGVEDKLVFFADGRRSFSEQSGAKRSNFAIDLAASIRRRGLGGNGYRSL